jgi:hypothetical protein
MVGGYPLEHGYGEGRLYLQTLRRSSQFLCEMKVLEIESIVHKPYA